MIMVAAMLLPFSHQRLLYAQTTCSLEDSELINNKLLTQIQAVIETDIVTSL